MFRGIKDYKLQKHSCPTGTNALTPKRKLVLDMNVKGYSFLVVSIVAEIFGTLMLKLSNGFTLLYPSLAVIFGYGLSFYFLALCLRSVPLSLAYAIWSGAGTALTALIGFLFWNEAFHLAKLLGIILIIGGILVLNTSDTAHNKNKTKEKTI